MSTNPQVTDSFGELANGANKRKWGRFTLTVLGAIPWIGSVLSAYAALQAEEEQGKYNELLQLWLTSHEERIKELEKAMDDISMTAMKAGIDGESRLESDAFLNLVHYGFRVWDRVPTAERRRSVRRTLSNAVFSTLENADLIRLFILWIDHYDDVHFRLISLLHKESGLTGADLWAKLDGRNVRDNSADADLYKLILRDLSTGGVIRQVRKVNDSGKMLRKKTGPRSNSPYLSTPIEGDKPYELTELGHLFVGYALNEPSSSIASEAEAE